MNDETGFDISDILDAVVSHAQSVGLFDRVNQFEPKVAPANGLWAAIFLARIDPAKSGLAETSVRVVWTVRIGTNMVAEPQDMIDANMMHALDVLMAAYTDDFTLDGLVRSVDVFGAQGVSLSGIAGYLPQANNVYRVIDISLPVIVNDVWTQNP